MTLTLSGRALPDVYSYTHVIEIDPSEGLVGRAGMGVNTIKYVLVLFYKQN